MFTAKALLDHQGWAESCRESSHTTLFHIYVEICCYDFFPIQFLCNSLWIFLLIQIAFGICISQIFNHVEM